MTAPATLETKTPAVASRRLPPGALIAALAAALLHMFPYWRADVLTPPGWTFSGNVYESIDFIQYRSWMRTSQLTGPFVDNRFTAEPNRPHLPVLLYYAFGKVAAAGGWRPEDVMAYAGSVFAFALTILLFVIVRHFLKRRHEVWWTFWVLLVGGGLGAHLKLIGRFDFSRKLELIKRLIVEPIFDPNTPVFEDYRGHYLFTTLFDTHYLAIWVLMSCAVLSLYFAVRKPSASRVAFMCCLFALTTLVHVYEAVTLISITLAVALLCRARGVLPVHSGRVFAPAIASATASLLLLVWFQRSSGIPLPTWREVNILPAMLFLAYPLAWITIFWRLNSLWDRAGFDVCFLLGWALGCTAIVLSGPFYPYPDRGTMTLQIPIYLLAGMAYFARFSRVNLAAAAIIVFLCAPTPAWSILKWWNYIQFRPDALFMYSGPEQRAVVDALSSRASSTDVLLAPEADIPWLAPQYPGKHYCAHFFLTVDYTRKADELKRFYDSTPSEQSEFLRKRGVRFVYVPRSKHPERFGTISDVSSIQSGSVGSLFEYARQLESPPR